MPPEPEGFEGWWKERYPISSRYPLQDESMIQRRKDAKDAWHAAQEQAAVVAEHWSMTHSYTLEEKASWLEIAEAIRRLGERG